MKHTITKEFECTECKTINQVTREEEFTEGSNGNIIVEKCKECNKPNIMLISNNFDQTIILQTENGNIRITHDFTDLKDDELTPALEDAIKKEIEKELGNL